MLAQEARVFAESQQFDPQGLSAITIGKAFPRPRLRRIDLKQRRAAQSCWGTFCGIRRYLFFKVAERLLRLRKQFEPAVVG